MHFTSVAILACAAGAAAAPEAKPYLLAVMPVPGQSLVSRFTNGYKPEETKCGSGSTCAEACGAGFDQCNADNGVAHCFNPGAGQSCCTDGTGNSCEAGFYCTHDDKKQTLCCPNGMDLTACAAAYSVTGKLEQAYSTTAPPPPPTTTSSTSTKPTTTTTPSTTSAPSSTTSSSLSIPVVTETKDLNTTVCGASSSGYTTAWTGYNSTITSALPTQPSESGPAGTTAAPTTVPTHVNGAAATSVSALLLVAAGVVALL